MLALHHLLLLVMLHVDLVEPRMLQGFGGADAQLWPQLEHPLEKIDARVVNLGQDLTKVLRGVHVKGCLVLRQLRDSRPCPLCWSSHNPKDANNLVLVRGTGKERPSGKHLGHDASGRPYVNARVVRSAS